MAKFRDQRPTRRGFTIVELVIAIAVSAIVIVTVSSALSRISKTRDVARTRLEAVTRANAALDAIRRDLSAVVRDGDLYFTRILLRNAPTFSDYGAVDRDEILVYNNRLRPMRRDDYAGEGGEYESQYRIEEDRDASVLWMRRDSVPDEMGEGGGMAIPVVDGIVGLQIQAYDGESWYDDWDSDIFGLPWALRVTVVATGESPDNPARDRASSTVSLRTQIPIDRIVPPPPPPEEESEEDAAAGTDPNAAEGAGTDAAAGAGGGMGGGMGGGGGPGLDGGGGISGGRPGRPGSKPTFNNAGGNPYGSTILNGSRPGRGNFSFGSYSNYSGSGR